MRDGLPALPLYRVRFRQRKCGRTTRGSEPTSSRSRSFSTGWSRHEGRPGQVPAAELLPADGGQPARAAGGEGHPHRRAGRRRRSRTCAARTPERGAKVVARAWVDAVSRNDCWQNGTKACEELGLDVPGAQAGRGGEHAASAQRHRLHAVLVLPAHAARHSARVVQVAQLPLAHGARAARGAGRSSD